MASKGFQDVVAWQKAHAYVVHVYRLTRQFPREELFGLTSHFRRAAVSIAANIAEGFKREGKADKLKYCNIAQASLEECRYYLILTRDLGYGRTEDCMEAIDHTSRLLESYMTALRRSRFRSVVNAVLCMLVAVC